eukprot:365883-Chlamydomonas_euryale.AAC.4
MSQTERKRKATVPAAGPAGGGGGGAPKVTRGGKELKVKNPEGHLAGATCMCTSMKPFMDGCERTHADLRGWVQAYSTCRA